MKQIDPKDILTKPMYYAKITYMDTANGQGLRTTLFVSGCRHYCKNCFNQETWDFHYGKPFTLKEQIEIINSLMDPHVKGITFLGGEPMEPENQPYILAFIQELKEKCPDKDIWLYTGCTFEELTNTSIHTPYRTEYTEKLLNQIDILVDGPFIEAQIDLIGSPFRGSQNQRIIRCKDSIKANQILLSHYMYK